MNENEIFEVVESEDYKSVPLNTSMMNASSLNRPFRRQAHKVDRHSELVKPQKQNSLEGQDGGTDYQNNEAQSVHPDEDNEYFDPLEVSLWSNLHGDAFTSFSDD